MCSGACASCVPNNALAANGIMGSQRMASMHRPPQLEAGVGCTCMCWSRLPMSVVCGLWGCRGTVLQAADRAHLLLQVERDQTRVSRLCSQNGLTFK